VCGERQHQREDADRGEHHHPPHKRHHRLAECFEESGERRARRLGTAGDGQCEQQREENQRHHRSRGRGSNRIRRKE
jgi:hypothetical protein